MRGARRKGAIVGLLSLPLHFPVFCDRDGLYNGPPPVAGSQRYQQQTIFGVPDGQR